MSLNIHSPNEVVEHIVGTLFNAEYNRLDRQTAELLSRNNALLKRDDQLCGFLVNGVFFKPKNSGRDYEGKTRVLELELLEEGNQLLKDTQEVARYRQAIKQGLVHLIWNCQNFQDLRDALPDFLKDSLTREIAALPRTREPAWSIKDNPRAMKQYLKILPKLEFYSATRLLFS